MKAPLAVITAQTEYAISALVELAGETPGTALRSPELAARLSVPAASMEQVMVRLRRHGLVHSYRGATGGYTLARSPEHLSLTEVLGVFLQTRDGERPGVGDRPVRQVVRELAEQLEGTIADAAAAVTVADLVTRIRERSEALALMPGL